MPEAYVFVYTTNPGPRAACKAIRKIKGVVRADALFGGPPVVAIVEGKDLEAMDLVVDAIVELPMVEDTGTHVVRPARSSLPVLKMEKETRPSFEAQGASY